MSSYIILVIKTKMWIFKKKDKLSYSLNFDTFDNISFEKNKLQIQSRNSRIRGSKVNSLG